MAMEERSETKSESKIGVNLIRKSVKLLFERSPHAIAQSEVMATL